MPLRTLIKDINAQLNGKGGGNDLMVQGSFCKTYDEIKDVIKAI